MNFYKETPPLILSKYDIEFFRTINRQVTFPVDAHIHSAVEFLYIKEGDFEVNIEGKLLQVHSGDLILVRSNVVHTIYHPSDNYGEYYVLKLTTQYLFNIFKGAENTDCLLTFLKSKNNDKTVFRAEEISCEIKSILGKMIEEYSSSDDMMLSMEKAYACIFIIAVFRTFFMKSCEEDEKYISRDTITLINESVEYINLNYASDITATECAKRVSLSYSYYAKLFRTITGKSFKEYLTAIRLTKAYNILIATELPVTDVALSCGYNNHAYFTAEYRRYYGKTPTETKKTALKYL